jgi:hypothetical protein
MLLLEQNRRFIVYRRELKIMVRIILMIMQVATGNVKEKLFGPCKISSGSSPTVNL